MKAFSAIVACAVLGHQATAAPIDDFNMDDLEFFDMMAAPTPMMTDMPMPISMDVQQGPPPSAPMVGMIPILGQAPPGAAPAVPNVGSAPPPMGKPAIGANVSPSIVCPQGCGAFSICGDRGCMCVNQNYEFNDKNNPSGGCKLKAPPKLQQKSTGRCLDYNLMLVDCGGAPTYSYSMGTLRTSENPPRCIGLRNDNDQGIILSPCNGKNQDWAQNDGMFILGSTQCLTYSSSLYAGSCYGTDDQKWVLA